MAAFHEILFPLDIALKSAGGPERKTEIVALGSGREERNARWAHSRRRYDAGYGVKTLDALSQVVAFFEERRGRLHGFRWRDRLDHSSAAPGASVTPLDQVIGLGDGDADAFQLLKLYGAAHAPYQRPIAKPVAGSVRVAVGGVEQSEGDGVHLRCGDRRRELSARACAGRGRVRARRISVRRAGALRHGLSRSRPVRLRGRQRAAHSAGGDQAVRAIPPALQAKLDSGVTTLARCWIITRRDGVVMGFTDHDADLTVAGTLCHAGTGLTASEATARLGLQVDGSEIAGALADDSLAESRSRGRALRRREHRGASGRLERALAQSAARQGRARRSAARGRGVHGRVALAQRSPQRGERAALHRDLLGRSRRCALHGRSRPTRRSTAAARSRRSPARRRSALRGWVVSRTAGFTGGKLTFTSGANAGFAVEVKTHRVALDGVLIELWQKAPEPIAVADAFTVTAGCDKRFATCRDRFANARQFPRLPAHPGQRLRHQLSGAGENERVARVSAQLPRREVKAARIAFEKLWHDLQLSAEQKAGFNPDQPRDDDGKWTDAGGGDAGKDGDGRVQSDEVSASKKAEIVRQFGKWTARQFISRYCRASINREMPGEFENVTIADIYDIAKGGDARARACLKLLKQDRFRK